MKIVPKDARPISEFTNQNIAFLQVIEEIRRVVASEGVFERTSSTSPSVSQPDSKKRYRAKTTFDDIDKQDYRRAAYKTIRDYFEQSIQEIDQLDMIRARFSDVNAFAFTCSILNKGYDRGLSGITIRNSGGSRGYSIGDITYADGENAPATTASGSFSIDADDYELFLTQGFGSYGTTKTKLTPNDAAELMWNRTLQSAGISIDA